MKPSEVRRELLEQHAALRAGLDRCTAMIAYERMGAATASQVRLQIMDLAHLVQRHNDREELLLRQILPGIDAWGPVRMEIMLEEHSHEHREIMDALHMCAGSADSAQVAHAMRALRDRIVEHMDREETVFLTSDLLRDDEIVIDAFGG